MNEFIETFQEVRAENQRGKSNEDFEGKKKVELINEDFFARYGSEDLTKKIFVKSNLKPFRERRGAVSFPVVLFEKNEAHPLGEIFVGDEGVHEVALTKAVVEKLRSGELIAVVSE